jgi:DNA-binding MarR family transcriptional regulator
MYYLATTERQHTRNASILLHPHGIHHREWRVLAILNEHNGRTIGHISDFSGLERSTLSKMIDAMEQRGWLRRGTENHDRRRSPVFLTEKGRRKLEETLPLILDLFHSYFEGMPPEDFRSLMRALRDLKARVARPGSRWDAERGEGEATQLQRPRRRATRSRS